MAKTKTQYVCSQCGTTQNKWIGQCPDCGEWNTLEETVAISAPTAKQQNPRFSGYAGDKVQIQSLKDVTVQEDPRLSTSMTELDRVLGGGLVTGSVVLIGVIRGLVNPPFFCRLCVACQRYQAFM